MTKPESFSLQSVPPTLAGRGRIPERFFDDRSGSVYSVQTAGSMTNEYAIAGLALAHTCGISTVVASSYWRITHAINRSV